MKTKEELLKSLFAVLTELQQSDIKQKNPALARVLQTKLGVLFDVLGEDTPEEYWEDIQSEIDESY